MELLLNQIIPCIENRTFDELHINDHASLVRTLTHEDIALFAALSGDVNPAHVDEDYARSSLFHKVVAHGMWTGALLSTVLGTRLPGPGTIYLNQTLHFLHPVGIGDTVTVTVKVLKKNPANHHVTLDCSVTNQQGAVVVNGTAEVLAPTEKILRPRMPVPIAHVYGVL